MYAYDFTVTGNGKARQITAFATSYTKALRVARGVGSTTGGGDVTARALTEAEQKALDGGKNWIDRK